MTYRKTVVSVMTRFRPELHRRLAKAAKAHDISMNEEIMRRLTTSFLKEDWQQERENWIIAIRYALENHPGASESALKKLKEIDDKAELEAWADIEQEDRERK